MNPTPTEAEVREAVERTDYRLRNFEEYEGSQFKADLLMILSALQSAQSDTARLSLSPFDPRTGYAIADMVNAFLKWPLPESVSADRCATSPAKGRTGTNILTLFETIQMMQEVVCPIINREIRAAMSSDKKGAGKV